MNKEFEALNYLYNDLRLAKCLDIVEEAKVKSAYECLRQAITELKAIKESEPSKAINSLNKLWSTFISSTRTSEKYVEENPFVTRHINDYDTIKQALLKQLSGSQITNIFFDEAQTVKIPINKDAGLKDYIPTKYEKELKALETELKEKINAIEKVQLKAQNFKKALEIIKKKDVDVFMLKRFKTLKTYNNYAKDNKMKELTQEEFELLKEMLKNE